MGLFDKFKKQTVQENEAETIAAEVQEEAKTAEESGILQEVKTAEAIVEQEESKEPAQEEQKGSAENPVMGVANEGRRFTMLVEDAVQLKDDAGVVVAGNLYGTLQKDDAIYLLLPNGTIALAKADGIEVGPGETADEAKNQKIALHINGIKDRNQIPRFTVLTSIRPQQEVDVNVSAENPQLLGLSMDYNRLNKDTTYMSLLIYVICHTRFVVPASADAEEMNENTPIHFPSLHDPENKDSAMFPVFTDWNALMNWKNLFDEKHPAKSIIMRFQEVLSVCRGSGIVINAFGPTPIILKPEVIWQIINMEGYKQEFGDPVNEQTPKMYIGVPKENEEVLAVKAALKAQAEKEDAIKRIDLLLTVDPEQKRTYLCVLECPEDISKDVSTKLMKAASSEFKEVEQMQFVLRENIKLGSNTLNEKSCVYCR